MKNALQSKLSKLENAYEGTGPGLGLKKLLKHYGHFRWTSEIFSHLSTISKKATVKTTMSIRLKQKFPAQLRLQTVNNNIIIQCGWEYQKKRKLVTSRSQSWTWLNYHEFFNLILSSNLYEQLENPAYAVRGRITEIISKWIKFEWGHWGRNQSRVGNDIW